MWQYWYIISGSTAKETEQLKSVDIYYVTILSHYDSPACDPWPESACDTSQIVTPASLWNQSACDTSQLVTPVSLWHQSACNNSQIVTPANMWHQQAWDTSQLVTPASLWYQPGYETSQLVTPAGAGTLGYGLSSRIMRLTFAWHFWQLWQTFDTTKMWAYGIITNPKTSSTEHSQLRSGKELFIYWSHNFIYFLTELEFVQLFDRKQMTN